MELGGADRIILALKISDTEANSANLNRIEFVHFVLFLLAILKISDLLPNLMSGLLARLIDESILEVEAVRILVEVSDIVALGDKAETAVINEFGVVAISPKNSVYSCLIDIEGLLFTLKVE